MKCLNINKAGVAGNGALFLLGSFGLGLQSYFFDLLDFYFDLFVINVCKALNSKVSVFYGFSVCSKEIVSYWVVEKVGGIQLTPTKKDLSRLMTLNTNARSCHSKLLLMCVAPV